MENEEGLSLLFWISTSVMLFLAIAFLFITLLYHKKTNSIKQKEAENLLKATLETEKKERIRIASDFHDSVSGDLSAIRNFINVLGQKENNSFNQTIFSEIKESLDTMMTNVRHINYNLMPPLLESEGLIITLKDYFERLNNLNEIDIALQSQVQNIDISTSDAYQIYRIIQELISNILKHNNASNIEVNISCSSNEIIIEILDNGLQFNFYENLKTTSGLGIKNILSRLNHVNALLKQIETEKGNKIRIIINRAL